MKNQLTKKFRLLVFLNLFCFGWVAVCFAQTSIVGRQKDSVLVDGNPALKQSHVEKLQDFFEWLFAARFAAAEHDEFQKLVIRKWQSGEKESSGILDIVKTHDGIQALSESDRAEVRRELLPKLLDSFRSGRSDINKFLAAVYESSRKNSSVADATENGYTGGSLTIADLAGTWSSGGVSTERYKNLTNGDLSDASGNMSEYIISKNGDIQYTGYLSTTIYACTTKLFFTKKGKITVSGSLITFDYKSGERDYQNSCNASLSGVKPIPPATKTVSFTFEREGQNIKLCTLDEGFKSCLYKVN